MSLSEVKFAIPAKKPIIESIRSAKSPDSCCTGFEWWWFVVFGIGGINRGHQSKMLHATLDKTTTIKKH
jgi:hypothetical protein